MYQGCQSSFQGGEQPLITSREYPNEEMDHKKGDRCLINSMIGFIKISKGCWSIYFSLFIRSKQNL